jgi:hypothetical protein
LEHWLDEFIFAGLEIVQIEVGVIVVFFIFDASLLPAMTYRVLHGLNVTLFII